MIMSYCIDLNCLYVFVEEQHLLIQFVKDVNQKYPQEYQAVRTSLPADIASKLDTCLTATNGTA